MSSIVYPKDAWQPLEASDAGIDPEGLAVARRWYDDAMGDKPYRVVMIRGGHMVAEWNRGIDRETRFGIASAAKSVYSNVLGILVDEGDVIPSADCEVFDYYPEFMDVPDGTGPKENRYAFPKDRAITFRQLISNTSGYMKPGEEPGTVFNYQTYGMNVLTHAMAKAHGMYDIADPEGSPGFKELIEQKIAHWLGVDWTYSLRNFDLHAEARLPIYGYYCSIETNAHDFARLGWMWRQGGRWGDVQVVPEAWLAESTRTNPDILAHCPESEWCYGYGFWSNDHGVLWPDLPRDAYSACGAGGHFCSVFPSQDLVIVQNPGRYARMANGENDRASRSFLELVLNAIR